MAQAFITVGYRAFMMGEIKVVFVWFPWETPNAKVLLARRGHSADFNIKKWLAAKLTSILSLFVKPIILTDERKEEKVG